LMTWKADEGRGPQDIYIFSSAAPHAHACCTHTHALAHTNKPTFMQKTSCLVVAFVVVAANEKCK